MVCMPWNEIDVMTEKERFIALVHSGRFTTTELCADFGISRKTGHKYLKRYQLDGRKGTAKGVSPSFHDFEFDCLYYFSFMKAHWHENPELNIRGLITT